MNSNLDKNTIDNNTEENRLLIDIDHKKSILSVFLNSLKLFLKTFSVRALITVFMNLKHNKYKFNFKITKNIFSFSNVRTSLSVCLLPLLFNLFMKMLSSISISNLNIFLSAFTSAFIAISIEEKTSLTNYIILSIFVRSIHTLFLSIMKKLNIYQETSRLWEFAIFFISASLVVTVYHLNPDYEPMRKLFESYVNYVDNNEVAEQIRMRSITKIV